MVKSSKFYLKTGDKVKVISGDDKGKISAILRIIRDKNLIVVKDVNVKKKHVKPKKEGEVGRILQFEAPIHRSNVLLYSEDSKSASRVSFQTTDKGEKVRIIKKSV